MMKGFSVISVIAGSMLLSSSVFAFEQHDAHVHGEAVINIVIENGEIEAAFKSPLMSITGFEYEPKSEADKALQAQALLKFKDVYSLVKLPPSAQCFVDDVEVHLTSENSEEALATHHKDEHEHEESETAHKDEHEHEGNETAHKDEHEHEHEHEGSETAHKDEHEHEGNETAHKDEHEHEGSETAHNDILARYRFKCVNPVALTTMDLDFIQAFNGIEKLEVNLLLDSGARTFLLKKGTSTIQF